MTRPSIHGLALRPALASDAGEIARLLTQLGHPTTEQELAERWSAWSRAGDTAWVAARSDGTLAGVATLHVTHVLHRARPVGRITALVIDAAERGQGLGRELVAHAEGELARAGCGLLEVTSNLCRGDAHAFYEHIGYERTSARFARTIGPDVPHAPQRDGARATKEPR